MKSRTAPTVAPRGSPSRPTNPSQGTKPPQTRVRSTSETRCGHHSPILTDINPGLCRSFGDEQSQRPRVPLPRAIFGAL